MDNPWATPFEPPEHRPTQLSTWKSDPHPTHDQEADIGVPSWSAENITRWSEPTLADGALWGSSVDDAHAWAPSTYEQIVLSRAKTPEQRIALQDSEEDIPTMFASSSPGLHSITEIPSSANHEQVPSTVPLQDSVPETSGGLLAHLAPGSPEPQFEGDDPDAWADSTILAAPDEEWGTAWTTVTSSESKQEVEQPLDEWGTALEQKEKLNRAVPPESLASMLRHCQQVSDEIWPARQLPGTNGEENWRIGFDGLENITELLDQLIPDGPTLPPPIQFSATATAKAMNGALKLTRHMPMSGSSPLSLLLASKGSLDWEKSIKTQQDIVLDAAHVGWRVLQKEDRVDNAAESKSKKAASGLLSFWNRRPSSIPAAAVETTNERSRSPARSSVDNAKPSTPPQPLRAASPSTAVPPPPSVAPEATPAPSAVSRFLNRFSRAKTSAAQHSSLALSSDDLEFLSDIVPSANDPDDEGDPKSLSSMIKSSSTPPKLPPPLAPPPNPPMPSSRPSSIIGLGMLDSMGMTGAGASSGASPRLSSALNVPVLPPPLSPMSAASFLRSQSPAVPPKDVTTANTSSTLPRFQSSSQPNSRSHSPFGLSPPSNIQTSLSIPPLLPPPPPLSPPQTPRPGTGPSTATFTPSSASTMWPNSASSFHDSNDSDDEFSAFASFSSAPFPLSDSNPPPRSPSPPSHRTYERTHYTSSSSISSILSPASQNSGEWLRSTRSSISASFDDFDDFVSPPTGAIGIRTPSPPPLPAKPQRHRQHPHPIDTFTSRSPHTHHTHTPGQTLASPTAHTGLISSSFSSPLVSHADHQRTQSLVNHAAARGGLLWPNSPVSSEESRVTTIPPPPSLTGEEVFDLLGDVEVFGSGSEVKTPPPPPGPASIAGWGIRMASSVSSPLASSTRVPPRVTGDLGTATGTDAMRQLSPSPPPMPSTSTPLLSFSSLSVPTSVPLPKLGPSGKPTQTGGLSAQDLSFFEGL
ncbi:hypothetical protein BS17DRAFT_785311 [Gyrodon lividus]|nr:hypothetical protein BS17DRAFT_785311 [Gyrodon lividus]